MCNKQVKVVGTGLLPKGYDVYLVNGANGSVDLSPPVYPSDPIEVYIKLINTGGNGKLTVNVLNAGVDSAHGPPFNKLSLAEPEGGAFALGTGGGDVLHLIYEKSTNSWYSLSVLTASMV